MGLSSHMQRAQTVRPFPGKIPKAPGTLLVGIGPPRARITWVAPAGAALTSMKVQPKLASQRTRRHGGTLAERLLRPMPPARGRQGHSRRAGPRGSTPFTGSLPPTAHSPLALRLEGLVLEMMRASVTPRLDPRPSVTPRLEQKFVIEGSAVVTLKPLRHRVMPTPV